MPPAWKRCRARQPLLSPPSPVTKNRAASSRTALRSPSSPGPGEWLRAAQEDVPPVGIGAEALQHRPLGRPADGPLLGESPAAGQGEGQLRQVAVKEIDRCLHGRQAEIRMGAVVPEVDQARLRGEVELPGRPPGQGAGELLKGG
jgi:hypothetical protein